MRTTVSDACMTVERDFAAAWWLLAEAAGHELHDEPELRWFHTGLRDAHLNAVLAESGRNKGSAGGPERAI